ncbi:glutathione S-transferase T3-like [Carya illinoinensis]|uniref:glutathione S-transferase T3-like n=1 Tax=Carya illinoinensis TaxID=32201 RepID=UPI001C72080D|nr:glutathione S-transferase T3-like [Carya illinoinensis]
MEEHFYDDPFFTTLLQSGGGGCNSTPTQHDNVVVQATPNDSEKRHTSKKVQRGASFTVEEDNLLVSAWLNISIDAIRGTDQKSTQMWERITTFYHEYKKPNIANRSEGSLMNRWSMIQKLTNKFCAYIAQVESLHPSGATEQDKIEKAKVLYKELVGTNFTMEHCWCLLRHQPKWQQHISTLGKKRRSPEKVSNVIDIDQAEEDIEVFAERPPGKKTEKERERKRKSMEGNDGEIKTALAKMTEDRATTMEERRSANLKASLERSAKFELKKRKFEANMMLLDLSGLNAMQQEYFGYIQRKIFEEWRKDSGGTSTSPSTPYELL